MCLVSLVSFGLKTSLDFDNNYNNLEMSKKEVQKAGRLADNPKRQSLVGGWFRKGNIALRGFPKGRAFWWLWSGEKKR